MAKKKTSKVITEIPDTDKTVEHIRKMRDEITALQEENNKLMSACYNYDAVNVKLSKEINDLRVKLSKAEDKIRKYEMLDVNIEVE